jgi:hypothetical protein
MPFILFAKGSHSRGVFCAERDAAVPACLLAAGRRGALSGTAGHYDPAARMLKERDTVPKSPGKARKNRRGGRC